MPRPAWQPPDPDDLIKRYTTGESKLALAAEHGVSASAIHNFLTRNGIQIRDHAARRRGHISDSQIPEIIRRYQGGESAKSLADSLGVTRHRINALLQDAGITPRGQGEAETLKWQTMTAQQRAAQVAGAHEAVRGTKQPIERRIKSAETRERNSTGASPAELLLGEWLRDLDPTPQKAIGVYNIDLAIPPVAVEIFGGGWHAHGRHAARTAERSRYILDRGWTLIVIWVEGKHRLKPAAADYVRALVDQSRRDPALTGQYRVIWGDGKDVTALYNDLDELSLKPADTRGRRGRS